MSTNTNKGSLVAERTLKALMLFAKSKNILVSDVAASLDISLAASYRIIDTLSSMGFIIRNEDKTYTLDPLNILKLYKMIEQDLRKAARPVLRELVTDLDESVYISILNQGRNFMYIDKEDNPAPFKWSTTIGEVLPIPAGTAGKTHLAYLVKDLPEAEKDAFISELELKPFTKKSITTPEELKKSINKILEDGYCITNSEQSNGVIGIAVPIFKWNQDQVVAVLGMHMLEANFSEEKLQDYVAKLMKGSKKISESIY